MNPKQPTLEEDEVEVDQKETQNFFDESPNKPSIKPNEEISNDDYQQPPQVSALERLSIMKLAEMQRIGGTHTFFTEYMHKYLFHIKSRKTCLSTIVLFIEEQKSNRKTLLKAILTYFKWYSESIKQFHEESYRYEVGDNKLSNNWLINLGLELKEGIDKLITMRRQAGIEGARVLKFVSDSIVPEVEKVFLTYGDCVDAHLKKTNEVKKKLQEEEKQFNNKVEKLSKIYERSGLGITNQYDLFASTIEFSKQQSMLRESLLVWSKNTLQLKSKFIEAEQTLILQLETVLNKFKSIRDYTADKLFPKQIKQQLADRHLLKTYFTPTDTDYIRNVLQGVKGKLLTDLDQKDYQWFLMSDYFSNLIGSVDEFITYSIVKKFPLVNPAEELIKTISGNFIHFDKKNKQIKDKFQIRSTKIVIKGQATVELQEIVKGIIFDSNHFEKIQFQDNNRMEEFFLYMEMESAKEE